MTLLGKKPSPLALVAGRLRAIFEEPPGVAGPFPARKAAVIGHRGAPRDAVENTVAGCRRAIDHGADGVEVDLCVTRDGMVVLWHDRDPGRSLPLLRRAASVGHPRIRPFPAHLRRPLTEVDGPQLAGIGIDTLEQFLTWAAAEPRAEWLMLDIKLDAHEVEFVPALLARLSDLVLAHPAIEDRKISLLTPVLEVYRALDFALPHKSSLQGFRIVADFEQGGVVDAALELGARHVGIGITAARPWSLSRHDVAAALAARRAESLDSIVVWTANDDALLREVAAWGVDAVLTDDVPLARRAIGP